MRVAELIEQLEQLEERHGDLFVELDSGVTVSDVDVIFEPEGYNANPLAIVIK